MPRVRPRAAVQVQQEGRAAGDLLDQAEALLSDPQLEPEQLESEPEPEQLLVPAALAVAVDFAPEEVGGAERVGEREGGDIGAAHGQE